MKSKPDADYILQHWTKVVRDYQKPEQRKSIGQVLNSFGPFFGLWGLMYGTFGRIHYGWTVGMGFVAALFLVRIFIIQHDCGHGSFFTSKKARDRLGFLCGVLTLTPYEYWQKTHHLHHATFGDLDHRSDFGDIEMWTVEQYLEKPWHQKLSYRLMRNPLILFGLGPFYQFFIKHRLPWIVPREWKKERRSIHLTNLCLLGIAGAAHGIMGIETFLLIQVPINLFAATLGIWLFYVQHQFEETYWERHNNWDYALAALRGSSFYKMPRIMQWFTGNIGYHHIHHLSPMIPNYALEQCNADHPEFEAQTKVFTFLESIQTIFFKLWDEEHKRMVGFGYLRKFKKEKLLQPFKEKLSLSITQAKKDLAHYFDHLPSAPHIPKPSLEDLRRHYEHSLQRLDLIHDYLRKKNISSRRKLLACERQVSEIFGQMKLRLLQFPQKKSV